VDTPSDSSELATDSEVDPDRAIATRPARIIVVLLAIAAAGALLAAQHLKGRQPLLDSAVWRPPAGVFEPQNGPATVSFKPYYADTLTVSVVHDGKLVAVIGRDYRDRAYQRSATFAWNGRTATGRRAAPGDYQVEVHFQRLDRTTLVPSVEFEIK